MHLNVKNPHSKMTKYIQVVFLVIIVFLSACAEKSSNTALEEFCKVIPEGWECEIIEDDFNENDIPKNTQDPIAIVKYHNTSREFTSFGQTVYPSLTLDIYPIKDKRELVKFITSQMMYSWCIPTYYGESSDFFVITSPCFINYGTFTEKADSCINDLHVALETILEKKDYKF